MKLHRDLDISQPSAWFMAYRIREAYAVEEKILPVTVEDCGSG